MVNGELSWPINCFQDHSWLCGSHIELSGLWQGFQQVGISMERLADIVDQIPEARTNSEKFHPNISEI